ncbi:MAG: hypothetical protein AAF656_03875 [Planctomycetota bacterium]
MRPLVNLLYPTWQVQRPIRVSRSVLVEPERVERYVRLATQNLQRVDGPVGVVVLFDADDDCAATLGPDLQKAYASMTDLPIKVCLAVREFEAWLVAGHLSGGDQPEAKRDAKRVLKEHFGRYTPSADQARLTARLDVSKCLERSRSFKHFADALAKLAEPS